MPRNEESPFDRFFAHALSVNALTKAELDTITDDIARGSQTEDSAMAAWLTRTRDSVWPFYKSIAWETPTEQLRFAVGTHVQARVGDDEWEAATVVALWYREDTWPVHNVAPYQMQLAGGDLIFAPFESESFVIAAGAQPPRAGKVDKAMKLGYGSTSHMREWEESGYGPLHACCMMKGDVAALKSLLRRPLPECNPNDNRNRMRESPLCMAATYGLLHCAILLLAAGADPRLPNCWRKSAVSIAEENSKRNGEFMLSSKWAHEALFDLLSRRAEELDAEDAEESGSVIG